MTYKLYQFEQCPFCEKVRQYLKQNNIECELVNVVTTVKVMNEKCYWTNPVWAPSQCYR